MAKDTKSVPTPSVQVPTTRSADFKTLYVNGARTAVTPYDIRAVFSALNDNFAQEPYAEEQIAVVVSPQLARVFLDLWSQAVQNYEKNFGPIPRLHGALQSDAPKAKVLKAH